MNDMDTMDTFKELIVRMPELELATLEELKAISFVSEAAGAFGKHLVKKAKNNPALAAQSAVWLADSQRAMETHLFTEAERGRRAQDSDKIEPKKAKGTGIGQGTALPSGAPPKWKRQCFSSQEEMETAELLDNHPEEVKEVIKEAKKDKDVPSKGAVKNKVRAKNAEKAAAKYKEEVGSIENKIVATGDALKYLSKLREIVLLLPATVAAEGWTESSYAEARSMIEIIQKRLGVWNERLES
jgi:hypothetical protein